MERSRVAIVIPALNEAVTIGRIACEACRYGLPIVVDDGSRDGTEEKARLAGAIVVRHAASLGYDQALNSGFSRAAGLGSDFVITMDADGQHDPAAIQNFVTELEKGADVVVGVRDRRQRFGEHLFALVGRLRWGIRDPLCGMKAYRIGVYRERGCFDSFGSVGTELSIFAASRRMKIAQIKVTTRRRMDQPRFGRRWAANIRIVKALIRCVRSY